MIIDGITLIEVNETINIVYILCDMLNSRTCLPSS